METEEKIRISAEDFPEIVPQGGYDVFVNSGRTETGLRSKGGFGLVEEFVEEGTTEGANGERAVEVDNATFGVGKALR